MKRFLPPPDKGAKAMSNIKTPIDSFEVKDLEDGSSIKVHVESCTEVGNQGKPGIQVLYMGNIVCFEPLIAERWAYAARKAGKTEYLLEDRSWIVHQDQFVKVYLVLGDKPKAKIEVKTRSKQKPVAKEYELPFKFEEE